LRERQLPPALTVSWLDFLHGTVRLDELLAHGAVLRIESPGEDPAVEAALLSLGAGEADPEENSQRLSRQAIARQLPDPGLILCPRQWFLGFRAALGEIERQLAAAPGAASMNAPRDIVAMFDKQECHRRFRLFGLPTPPTLGRVRQFEDLLTQMRGCGWTRVFVKPAHGSSASGMVALAVRGSQVAAYSTVEMVRKAGGLRLYNSLRIRRYDQWREVAELIDALCREVVVVERWLPKACLAGQALDLRVVVIAGQARHTVVRISSSPFTNLHLGNRRGNLAEVRGQMKPADWDAAMADAAAALQPFPDSLYGGVDLLIETGWQRHALLEVNAFGDLLPGLEVEGKDIYATEIDAVLAGAEVGA
jgi:glutathione synthase/RimK-type ligase-like ATP-grasp enzyme